jgi:hypothetical protein
LLPGEGPLAESFVGVESGANRINDTFASFQTFPLLCTVNELNAFVTGPYEIANAAGLQLIGGASVLSSAASL